MVVLFIVVVRGTSFEPAMRFCIVARQTLTLLIWAGEASWEDNSEDEKEPVDSDDSDAVYKSDNPAEEEEVGGQDEEEEDEEDEGDEQEDD